MFYAVPYSTGESRRGANEPRNNAISERRLNCNNESRHSIWLGIERPAQKGNRNVSWPTRKAKAVETTVKLRFCSTERTDWKVLLLHHQSPLNAHEPTAQIATASIKSRQAGKGPFFSSVFQKNLVQILKLHVRIPNRMGSDYNSSWTKFNFAAAAVLLLF